MNILVQKFGGTSLADGEKRRHVVRHIINAKEKGTFPVVVVSAMGRAPAPYATDSLLALLNSVNPAAPPRERDLLASCGEIISASVLVAELAGEKHKAVALCGWQAGIITDGVHGQAQIVRIRKDALMTLLKKEIIPVVAGFQGVSEENEVTTLGRGGSDTTAVALGAALGAKAVEIYSDVDAVMTADPRLVPEAKPIKNIGYQELLQLAREGAKVVHPSAVDIALQFNLPLILKKTGHDDAGTRVSHPGQGERGFLSKVKVVSGITYVMDLAQVRIIHSGLDGSQLEQVLERLAKEGISIDLINISPGEKMFTVPEADAGRVKEAFRELDILAEIRSGFAKVSVVGSGMRGTPGVMATVVKALNIAGTEILQTADSHLSISCLVKNEDVSEALRALHLEFGLS